MNVVLKEGYSATAPDLSSLVTTLRRARPDVILHTGYNPDITLFLRQAQEQGLKWAALICRRRLRPDRPADGDIRQGHRHHLQRETGGGPVPRPEHTSTHPQ